jgi:hypothetical protein
MFLHYWRAFREARRATAVYDVPAWQRDILARVRPFTMAGDLRTLATVAAVEYVEKRRIPGAIVECGVWRGGQMMAAALTLRHLCAERDLYLFDTFRGMTAPGPQDSDFQGEAAGTTYAAIAAKPDSEGWCEAGIDDVRHNLARTGYPASRCHLVQGDVEVTLPAAAPETVAYLRLDTDWYASTAHEFEHLYPRVPSQGVVAIDDYGHWQGARRATDEYLEKHGVVVLLQRIDYSARQFVKP